jgi:hypothetical protein
MNILARNSKIVSPVAPPVKAQPPAALPCKGTHRRGSACPATTLPVATRPHAGPSIIGAALTVTGQLQSAGDIQIEGKVEGDIHAQVVGVGSTAVIKGTVFGDVVESAGTIEGKIEARKAILLATARCLATSFTTPCRSFRVPSSTAPVHPHPKAEKIERPVEALPPPKVNPSDSDA